MLDREHVSKSRANVGLLLLLEVFSKFTDDILGSSTGCHRRNMGAIQHEPLALDQTYLAMQRTDVFGCKNRIRRAT